MAISTTWSNFVNGATGLAIRNALNTFNTNILVDVISNEGRVAATEVVNTSQSSLIATNISNINNLVIADSALDTRVSILESSHELLMVATSLATVQTPTTLDVAIQVEFGASQTTTDINLSALGAITFNTGGKYILSTFFQYGRAGSAETSVLLNRYLINGVQLGSSLAAKVDNADILVPWSSSIQLTVVPGDVLTIELMRDSVGNNSGGLFSITPTLGTWAVAPCSSFQIYKAV